MVNSAAAAKSIQLCLTLCDPIDSSPSGSPIPGILQARTLESVAISFSNAWKWKVKGKSLSRVRLFTAPWTAPHQAPPSVRFSRQEYWSGLPLPSPHGKLVPLNWYLHGYSYPLSIHSWQISFSHFQQSAKGHWNVTGQNWVNSRHIHFYI